MPLLILILCVLAGTISSCDAAHSMTIEQRSDFDQKIDLSVHDEIESYVCSHVECDIPLHVDEIKMSGTQLAALHVSYNYHF